MIKLKWWNFCKNFGSFVLFFFLTLNMNLQIEQDIPLLCVLIQKE